MRTLEVYVDGSSLGNPGPGGIGIVVTDVNDTSFMKRYARHYKKATNNHMEIEALYGALYALRSTPEDEVTIYTDSALVVNIMSGQWKCKSHKDLWSWIRNLHAQRPVQAQVHHLRKDEQNPHAEMAHKLAQQAARDMLGGQR